MEKFPQEHTPVSENIKTPEAVPADKIMTVEDYSKLEHQTPYLYELKADDKELFYFGAYHSRNPEDPIFDEIKKKFEEIQPDLVMVEGMSDINRKKEQYEEFKKQTEGITPDQVIDMAGESGFALMLAIEKGVECESPEPEDSLMYESLIEQGFSKEDIFAQQIFLVLPQYHRQINREGFEKYATSFINKFKENTNWEGFDYSYENALKIASDLVGKEVDVENEPDTIDWVDPIPWEHKKDSQTVMNKISAATSRYRDRFMVEEVANALKTHKKVFVVFGASHAVMQQPALAELFK